MFKKIIMLMMLAFLSVGCSEADKSMEAAAVSDIETEEKRQVMREAEAEIADADNLLDDGQKDLLYNFALGCAQTLQHLTPADFYPLFAESEGEERYLNDAAYSTLCTIRSMQDKDMTLEYAKVCYRVESVYDNGYTVTAEVCEDNVQKFKHLQNESYTYNTYHKFVLINTDEGWKVKSHLQEEDFFLMAIEAWEDVAGGTLAEKAVNAVQLLKADAEENFALAAENLNEYREIAVSKEYDREKAVEYAAQWCNKRSSEYLEYDLYGGNCQNFASQCIHAGGMDMDIKGSYTCQWKFYGKDLNFYQSAAGRSYSWIGVDEFYTYAVNNSGTGLALQPDISLEYAEKGDVIQVGAYYKWRHSLVVADVLRDENGNVTEIILASNTADRWNYPLSAYIYTYPRLIHVDGQY
ncbi:MAG: amidase domain-containing protein [Oscillospiraceae bacterium]|nr:amidase domain-containing protein [Oscillospiraceae bacterium]